MNGIILKLLTGGAACLYGMVCILSTLSEKKERLRRIYPEAWLLAAALNTSVIVINWIKNGYVHFVSMYQVLVLLSLCFGIVHIYVSRVRKISLVPYFSGGSCLVSVGTTVMDNGSVWHFAPALKSPFFIPHIFCYMVAYTLAAVAFLLALRDILLKKQSNDSLECIRILFPFMTAGLFLGAIWANEVWGTYWSWDLKECWSLFSWMCYVCVLHLAKIKKFQILTKLFLIAGFVGVVITFFFVNMMNTSSIHAYAT